MIFNNYLQSASHSKWFLLLFASLTMACQQEQPKEEDRRSDFNDDWLFSLEANDNAYQAEFNDENWRKLNLPHDWSIEGEFSEEHPAGFGGGALPGGIGWYRKSFTIAEEDEEKVFYIDFDGVYQDSEVWINGEYLGKRPNGYISFRYELTDHLQYGDDVENVIAVKVDNSKQPNSRWYSGSGIYRNVWLVKTNPLHIAQWGTFVTTPEVTADVATVVVKTQILNRNQQEGEATLETIIQDADGNTVAEVATDNIALVAEMPEQEQTLTLDKPALWSVDVPNLYTVVSTVKLDGDIVDRYETPLGVRYFEFDASDGFSLNGESMIIKGVCNHHDLGALGAAINTRALERQLEILRGMGVNAIRTAHNPPAPELLELCDKMGFIVMDEVFDMWAQSKTEHDYSQHWDEWHEQDLEDFLKRDRNHPSVLMWSIGNEIPEQWDSAGYQIAKHLGEIVKSFDDTRPVTAGLNHPYPDNTIYRSGALDLVGFNYHHEDFESFPEDFPGEKFIGTETNSALATRGYYDMPSDSIRRWPIQWDLKFTQGNPDLTVSAYDNVSAPWGSTHEETWKLIKKHDYLSGMFIWTGFDYLGEPTPYEWPARSSYFGVVDLAGFPKDSYYMYKSEWTKDTVLHVLPHWNWEEGQKVDVWAYYNHADEVELFLNEQSQGIMKKEGDDLHVAWTLNFEPGTVKVVSRKDGETVLTKEVSTAGAAANLRLTADRETIKADGKDLVFITIDVLDEAGNLVPRADNLIQFELNGDARILATDNGDPTSMASFQAPERKAFHGKALVIVQADKSKGSFTLTANAQGLAEQTIDIQME